jgi:hypothetical protein
MQVKFDLSSTGHHVEGHLVGVYNVEQQHSWHDVVVLSS